jgi:hypothetical protein
LPNVVTGEAPDLDDELLENLDDMLNTDLE